MKLMKSRYFLVIFCCLTATVVLSCKPKQKVIYSTTPVEEKGSSQLFSDITDSDFSYITLSSRLNLSLTSGTKSLSSRANLRIVKDNAIQISIQPLFGVEVFRLYIDPDTVVVLDRMNKRYVKESITSIKEQYPIGFDYYTMQSILTNSIFVSGKSKIDNSDFNKFKYDQTSDRSHYLVANDNKSGIDYSFTINGDDRITFTHLMQHQKKQSLQWAYSNFAIIGDTTFPHKMNALLISETTKIDAEFQFSDIIRDEQFTLSISIPSGYSRTSAAEILKIISSGK